MPAMPNRYSKSWQGELELDKEVMHCHSCKTQL